MDEISKCPLKLFIQDIYRAQETSNKYVYELFGQSFKNIMIHGVITAVYNNNETTTNLELSDPTGTVQIYYSKSNSNSIADIVKDLRRDFEKASRFGDPHLPIMHTLMEGIIKKYNQSQSFEEGSCLSVVGDIFMNDLNETRMVSAYQCVLSDFESDLIWLEELNYLYEKHYLYPR